MTSASAAEPESHVDPKDGMTVYGGVADCPHRQWAELPDVMDEDDREVIRPASDVCIDCGGVKY